MKSIDYAFPKMTDPDPGDNPTVFIVIDSNSKSLPNFITITSTPSLTIYPTLMT
jgi:hypothetical protein